MFCRYCGKEIPEDANFCPYCQKKLSVEKKEEQSKSEKVFVPTPAVDKRKIRNEIPKEESQTSGILAWLLSTYNIVMIAMLVLGMLGYYTTGGEVGDVWGITFKGSSLLLISAVGFMCGYNFSSIENIPVWIGYVIPFTISALALTFAIVQICKNKKKFSITTISVVGAITLIVFLITFVFYAPIIENLSQFIN